jgi:hypothetical protein|tara:strand:- start:202 stop:438 length:237 start_codon:yes stop_codon:yes gene_type:complete
MNFQEITENSKVFPGEYLLHIPSNQIVVCGAYKPSEGKIKALANGRLMEDAIVNFQKIKLSKSEKKKRTVRHCGGCKR